MCKYQVAYILVESFAECLHYIVYIAVYIYLAESLHSYM